ncbi:MAG: hypothetical protein HYS87_03480 [Candidatus Colwellbacteria bacterium]|nr:hypothetical protein [Candidatus Colwellbacteria bacterium]
MAKKGSQQDYLALFALAIAIFFVFITLFPFSEEQVVNSDKFVPSPSERGEVFTVSSGERGPRIVSGFIDPFDIKRGEEQMFSVHVTNFRPVKSVTVTIKTETQEYPYQLELLNGRSRDGFWQGKWAANYDSVTGYNAVISAYDATSDSIIELTL